MEGRRLDNFVFQRTCLETLGIVHLNPKAQMDDLTRGLEKDRDPKYHSAVVPPWEKLF